MPQPSCLPSMKPPEKEVFCAPSVPALFSPMDSGSLSRTWTGVDPEAALMAIVSSHNAQEATGLDRQGLLQRFTAKWTPDSALKDCRSFAGLCCLLSLKNALRQLLNDHRTLMGTVDKEYLRFLK